MSRIIDDPFQPRYERQCAGCGRTFRTEDEAVAMCRDCLTESLIDVKAWYGLTSQQIRHRLKLGKRGR